LQRQIRLWSDFWTFFSLPNKLKQKLTELVLRLKIFFPLEKLFQSETSLFLLITNPKKLSYDISLFLKPLQILSILILQDFKNILRIEVISINQVYQFTNIFFDSNLSLKIICLFLDKSKESFGIWNSLL
jgi:hypothetical protein